MTVARVRLWGRNIGAVSIASGSDVAAFEYEPAFAASGIEISPLMMPLSLGTHSFPALPKITFRGLPGLLADSLPDRFGNALIDVWLATQGRAPASFDAVERLCHTGTRGMGALEFAPMIGPRPRAAHAIEIDHLVSLASDVLAHRESVTGNFHAGAREKALKDILAVGTSAGGARAKAVIAWNPLTNEVRSGQVTAGEGFEYWLLKFDGVTGNKDKELEDPKGYGAIEYAYHLMARAAGIANERVPIAGGKRSPAFHDAAFRSIEQRRKIAHAIARRDRASRFQSVRRALVRAGATDHPPTRAADGGNRRTIPPHGLQHCRAQSG